ncbi:lytic transglycosylase domain-containing protein [Sphingomonas sp.]|uniref:lytic transglycosylase domain-containing protein n=1 Tax=Sphingomonas sp. TaxID=28214 RepID=UPI003B005B00
MVIGKRLSCMVVLALLAARPAFADVIEIGDDGAARTRSGGGVVSWSGGVAEIGADDGAAVPDAAITAIEDAATPIAYRAALTSAARRYALSPSLLAALVARESGWRAGAVSVKGAQGLAQLMPSTARMLAVDAHDPAANLDGGARYLRLMLDHYDGDVERALAAYNAGPGRVDRARGVPAIPETRAYVSTILDRLGPVVQPVSVVR